MPEKHEEIVRSAVAQALERQLPTFRESIVQEVLRAVDPAFAGGNSPVGSGSASAAIGAVQKAISAVQAGTTQKEILRALLDGAVLCCGRAALFVVKNGSATGWQGAGFAGNEAIKDFSLDVSAGLVSRVLQGRVSEDGSASEFDQHFISQFGAPAENRVGLLPLLLKEKVSALIYADGGPQHAQLDTVALDVLVKATSAWLEVISQRKQAQRDGISEPEMHAAPAVNDPFAAHAPLHTAAKAQSLPEAAPMAMSAAASAGGTTAPALSAEEADVHRKAQRFARLLMDEIKLYNQAKVSEGRKHKDLYDRLKEDIEKSRSTYLKRYGNTSAVSADYFNQELVRSLAEDDISLMGKNFHFQK